MPDASQAKEALGLLSDNARVLREVFRRRALHLGVTQPQWRVLLTVRRDPGLSQATLAERLEVHAVTVTQAVDRLVRDEWLRRTPHERDRRAVRLYVTERAAPLLNELDQIADEVCLQALAGLEREQVLLLTDALRQVKRNLTDPEANPESVDAEARRA